MTTIPCTHEEGPYHDCAYVDARNALIDAAERRSAVTEATTPGERTRQFFAAMDELAVKAGLVRLPMVRDHSRTMLGPGSAGRVSP